MAVVLFLVILIVLIVGHEAGHFIVAKLSGMKVPEFGLGFPPKIWGKKIGDTEYTINALPFGGFVKIFGEDDAGVSDPRAFAKRPKILQVATLAAGPFANLVLAFMFATVAFMVGVPTVIDTEYEKSVVRDAKVLLVEILPGSPAQTAGLKAGDEIVSVTSDGTEQLIKNPLDVSDAILNTEGEIVISFIRNKEVQSTTVLPQAGIDPEHPEKRAIGIGPALVGTLSLPIHEAFVKGMTDTVVKTQAIFSGLMSLIGSAFTLTADVSNIAGPVGIVSLVGDASGFGLGSVLLFTALISINLALVNLLPFPALDGGRLALLFIETVIRRPIPPKFSDALNIGGFVLLILIMLAVTAHDVVRLFG
ncbi:hypothetical protein EPO56_00040 [Patescibacteria group bacterium]|nr:MAG: hypothetical protein EPO56_00040 [Patescibacteria group bacterium]